MQKPEFMKLGRRFTKLTPEQEQIRADYIRWYRRNHVNMIRLEIVQLLGGVCKKCGFSDARALQIDHIQGGGNAERRDCPRYPFLNKVLASIANGENLYQLLCANCNWIKRMEDC